MKRKREMTPRDKPTELAEIHLMAWKLYAERIQKVQAQFLILQGQAQALQGELKRTEDSLNEHKKNMRLVYEMADTDSVDMETGVIQRTSPAAEKAG